jgi:hypothetical protein
MPQRRRPARRLLERFDHPCIPQGARRAERIGGKPARAAFAIAEHAFIRVEG